MNSDVKPRVPSLKCSPNRVRNDRSGTSVLVHLWRVCCHRVRLGNVMGAVAGGLFVVIASLAMAQRPSEAELSRQTTLQPIDVFEIEFATDPQIAPSGDQIVYVRNRFDIMTDSRRTELWIIDDRGIQLPLVTGTANYSSPRWSPDSSRLAYISNEDGRNQIHCLWLGSGRTARLTNLTESPSDLTWSRNGDWLAFSMRVPEKAPTYAPLPTAPQGAKWADPPEIIDRLRYRADGAGYLPYGHTHLFVVPADGGTPRQLTHGPFDHSGPFAWIESDSKIVFSANRHEDHELEPANSELYTVDTASREIVALTDRRGPDSSPASSPNGNWIVYTGHDEQYLGYQADHLYVVQADGSERRILLDSIDRSLQRPVWQDDDTILFQYDDHGVTKIAAVDLDGEVTELASHIGGTSLGRPYGGGSFSVALDGTLAYTHTTPQRPSDVVRREFNGKQNRVTHLNEDLFGFKRLGRVEKIEFRSSFDELPLEGWMIYPPDFVEGSKVPMILEIHGGPFANYGPRFTAELQLMAAAGYVVFYMNPRGSTSYGSDFANKIHHHYPGEDYDDLMSGVDAAIATGVVDPDRLFVTGGSGGGVLTAWIVGNTDRFRAAVVCKPVINWYSFVLTSDAYNLFYKYWFPGFPWDHTEHYMKRSPISRVGNVTTPTMLLTGTEDYRTPMSETEQFYQALKLRQVETMLVRIPGAGHGIAGRPSRLIAKVAHILKWFDEHGGKPEKTPIVDE